MTRAADRATDRSSASQGAFPLNRDPALSAQPELDDTALSDDVTEVGYKPVDIDIEALPLDQRTAALEHLILGRLDDDKAQEVVHIDLRGKSSIADGMIVASGRSHRHVGAMADHLLRTLKDAGHGRARVEGLPHCDWVLIDAGDVIVHLFRPEVRSFYNIEKIWAVDAPHRTPSATAFS
jgi:ribosome-associated protein